MATIENTWNVSNRMHSNKDSDNPEVNHIIAGADEIYDDSQGRKQNEVNTDVARHESEINDPTDGLQKRVEDIEAMSQIGDTPVETNAGNIISDTSLSGKVASASAVNGVYNALDAQTGYYTCGTTEGEAAKTVDAPGFVLSRGGSIKIKMTNANSANNATLNINSTGAKALYYDGERAGGSNTWEAGETIEVYYDGTSYYANNVAGGSSSGVFDVSKKFPTSGVEGGDTYTLELALSVLNANLSANKKEGGMEIKFVSSSDNKYVQYRYMSDDATTVATFTNIANWQGIISESNSAQLQDIPNLKGLIDIQKDEHAYYNGSLTDQYFYLSGVNIGDTYTITVSSSNGYSGELFDVSEGNMFILSTSNNTSNAKAYAILDSENKVLAISQNANDVFLIIPQNGAKLIVNSKVITDKPYFATRLFYKAKDTEPVNIPQDLSKSLTVSGLLRLFGNNNKMYFATTKGYYANFSNISIGSVYSLSTLENSNYTYEDIQVDGGDVFVGRCIDNTSSAKAYAILDEDNIVIDYKDTWHGSALVMPQGAKRFIVNTKVTADAYLLNVLGDCGEEIVLDNIPVKDSENPVKSGGVYSALKEISDIRHNIPFINKGHYISFASYNIGTTPSITVSSGTGYYYAIIECKAGDVFIITTVGNTSNARSYSILGGGNGTMMYNEQEAQTDKEVVIPHNGDRLVVNSAINDNAKILYVGNIKDLTTNLQDKNENIYPREIEFAKNSGYINMLNVSVGDTLAETFVSNSSYRHAEFKVYPGDIVELKTSGNTVGAKAYALLDKDNKVLKLYSSGEPGLSVLIPEGCVRMVVNTRASSSDEYYIKAYDYSTIQNLNNTDAFVKGEFLSDVKLTNGYFISLSSAVIGSVFDYTSHITEQSSYGYYIYIFKYDLTITIRTSGNTTSAKAYVLMDKDSVVKEIKQDASFYTINGSKGDILIINTNKSDYDINVQSDWLENIQKGIFERITSKEAIIENLIVKTIELINRNTHLYFDDLTLQRLETALIRLDINKNVPVEGACISTDSLDDTVLDNNSSMDAVQAKFVPYLYWNQQKIGTIVLYDDATGNPYIYNKNGEKKFLTLNS